MIILQRVPRSLKETNSQNSLRGPAVPSLNPSGLVSDCSPLSLPSLPGLLALPWTCQAQAHLKAYVLPVPSSWNVLLPDNLREHFPIPLIPCLEEPHLTIHLICTSKSSLPVSLYIDLCIFPQHLPSMLALHNIL